MHHNLFLIQIFSCLLFWGCTYHPPINELPLYGFPERSMEEISNDSLFQRDLKSVKNDNDIDRYIAEGFSTLKDIPYAGSIAIRSFNKAWLLDSLNPHIYMGYALAELERWNGTVQNAINYYTKYLELYKKNPIPRPTKQEKIFEENEAVESANLPKYVYGKLISLEKDNGYDGHWEENWPSIAITDDDNVVRHYLLESNTLHENERNALNLNMRKNFNEGKRTKISFYTQGEIKIFAYYDEKSAKWITAPKDSIFTFTYVERTGLFFSEEQKSLVNLGKAKKPDSTARIFLLKPYAFQNGSLVLNSYSEKISGDLLPGSPYTLKLTPYQEKTLLHSPSKIQVRSGIIHALTEEKYDSLRIFLDAALEIEKIYGSMPISDREYILLSLLNNSIPNDSIFRKKLKTETLRESKKHSSPEIKDSLNLLITYRLYPQIHTVEFEKKVSIYSHLWWDLKKYVRNQFPE
mgnify:CR=1 FL=1